MTRYFLDTEFLDDGVVIMPISLALVCEDGRELYIEFEFDAERAWADPFLRDHVLPHLRGQEQYNRSEAARVITLFLRQTLDVEIWAYFASYDWVLFCQIFGSMMNIPNGIPRHCMDLVQWWVQMGRPRNVKPPKPVNAHDALADAHWNRVFYRNLVKYHHAQYRP